MVLSAAGFALPGVKDPHQCLAGHKRLGQSRAVVGTMTNARIGGTGSRVREGAMRSVVCPECLYYSPVNASWLGFRVD